jgi:transposase-like protein
VKRIATQEYTAEFKEQAVKRVDKVGSIGRVAEALGRVEQTRRNWVKAAKAGKLNPADAKQITAEQMELSRLRAQVARLEMDNEILKKRRPISRRSCGEIGRDREAAQSLPVARPVRCPLGEPERLSGLAPERQRLTDAQALVLIRTIDQEVKQAYGARRIYAQLRGRGDRIGLPRIERLMREHGRRARHTRRYKATNDARHRLPGAQNVLDRQFAPEAHNRVCTGDITGIAAN